MHQSSISSYWWPVLAAAIALVVVHGFGRFVYTPLLPLLVEDGLLSLAQAAAVASWNYLGYLTGAFLALFIYQLGHSRLGLFGFLLLNAISTLLQVWADSYSLLAALRLINGIANGVVFALAPALVLEWLVEQGKSQLSGLMYLGVGAGILLSSLLVDFTEATLNGAQRWWPAALAAIPLALWSGSYLLRLPEYKPKPHNHINKAPLWDKSSTPLFLSYAGAGLGYILPMTFLPAVAKEWQVQMVPSAWLVVALASLPSTWLWNWLGAKFGDKPALLWNYIIQASSILALLWLDNWLGLWLCALLMGSSFLGCVLLTQRMARALQPHQGPKLGAALIALYGVTQLSGPWLAKIGIEHGATLASTFVWGLGALVFAIILTLWVPKTHS